MARRRNIVPCPICRERDLRFTDEVICGQCLQDIQKGREVRGKFNPKDSESQTVILGAGFLYDHWLPEDLKRDFSLHDMEWDKGGPLARLILLIAGNPVEPIYNQEGNQKAFYPTGGTAFTAVVTNAQARAIKLLADWIGAIRYKSYQEGFQKGRQLLMGLANGTVTIDKFNTESNR